MATKTLARSTARQQSNGTDGNARKLLASYGHGTATVADIPITKLVIEEFQRDLSDKAKEEMVGSYDPNQFQLLTVCAIGDGTYSLVDGQHRKEMAKSLGITTITCQVVTGLDYQQRSELFINLNRNRRWLVPAATFKSEVEAGKPWAKEVTACLESRGLEIKSKHRPSGIASVMAVKRVYTNGGTVRLGRVLDAILSSWPDDDPRRFAGQVILGVNMFIADNPKADLGRLSNGLRTITAQRLIALSTQRWYAWKALDGRGGNQIEAVAQEIKKVYAKARA